MRQPVVGPRKDQPDVDRCAGMHERLGNGRGCMAAVRGQQSRGCGSERQVGPYSLMAEVWGRLAGEKPASGKGPHDDVCPGPNLWVKCASLARV